MDDYEIFEDTQENDPQAEESGLSALLTQLMQLTREKYKIGLLACLLLGITLGSLTQAVYGSAWNGLTDAYCAGWRTALQCIAPVTLGFVGAMLLCAPFRFTRLLIAPAACVRGMGLGALICGVTQMGTLRELCFAALVLLPYAVTNAALAVYAGEYALGLRGAFTQRNAGLTGRLALHTAKMTVFYLMIAALSCGVFALSCLGFGRYLM